MHLIIINGSPRPKSKSNSQIIIDEFLMGYCATHNTYEIFNISNRSTWQIAKETYRENINILIVLPLYTESLPSLLLEFLETLTDIQYNSRRKVSFILQSGFIEACQRHCCETLLKQIPGYIGGNFAGILSKGNMFPLWLYPKDNVKNMIKDFNIMGKYYAKNGSLIGEEVEKLTGSEYITETEAKIINRVIKFALNDFAEVFETKIDLMFAPYDQ